jgi:hypothetical protein
MTTIRVKKDSRYFTASNEPFNDKNLSWETRGLMGYLLSKPNNWQIRMDALEKAGPAGNYKLRRMLAEARKYGYMNRIRITLPGNKFDWITEVYESPSLNPNPSASYRKSTSGSSTSGKPTDIVNTEGEITEPLNIEGDQPKTPVTEPTEDEILQARYEMIIFQVSANHRGYFDEFFRLTKMLPEGKKQIKEWIDALSSLWSAKVLVTDMEPALTAQLEANFTVKNPGSLLTTMQTIKMRREKGITVKPKQIVRKADKPNPGDLLKQYALENGLEYGNA